MKIIGIVAGVLGCYIQNMYLYVSICIFNILYILQRVRNDCVVYTLNPIIFQGISNIVYLKAITDVPKLKLLKQNYV